jgi:malate/lactate dehydrogenase
LERDAAGERTAVLDEVHGWSSRWQAHGTGTTSAWTSAWGAAALVDALLQGDAQPWPVSTLLHGEYGVDGVSLTVPALLGPDGPRPLQWTVDPDEQAAIARAAAVTEELACASC